MPEVTARGARKSPFVPPSPKQESKNNKIKHLNFGMWRAEPVPGLLVLPYQNRVRDKFYMPSLYFTDAGNHCGGMLRAVLSWEDCECVLADQPAIRIGS